MTLEQTRRRAMDLGMCYDPAASGPRWRARPNGYEVVVYEDGRWFVCVPGQYTAAMSATAESFDRAFSFAWAMQKAYKTVVDRLGGTVM